jgi:hypothetical protein
MEPHEQLVPENDAGYRRASERQDEDLTTPKVQGGAGGGAGGGGEINGSIGPNNHQNNAGNSLDRPRTSSEACRDSLLQLLDHRFFQVLGIVVLVLIVVDGAFFFFLLIGGHTLCRPRLDCQPRNDWYNASIQILNILFSYGAIVAMPWRVINFLHLTVPCPRRCNDVGCDLYGRGPAPDIWFHIPKRRRLGITILLILNAVFQFINQGTRIYYPNFEVQDAYPGNVWTNVFFGLSFLCAGIAAGWLGIESGRIRTQKPGTFGLGPIETIRQYMSRQTRRPGANGGVAATATPPYEDSTRDHSQRSVLFEDGEIFRSVEL